MPKRVHLACQSGTKRLANVTDNGWKDLLASRDDAHVEELLALLRIPSVSTDPAHKGDVETTANYVKQRLLAAGVPTVDVVPTPLHPVVIGEWIVDPAKPTVLIYGHYDVQPEEPVELWMTPAFEPDIRDGKIYARRLLRHEGQPAYGRPGRRGHRRSQRWRAPDQRQVHFRRRRGNRQPKPPRSRPRKQGATRRRCGALGRWWPVRVDTPFLTASLKGLGGCQVNLRTANTDLHSGMFGAKVPNAVQSLVQLAATFHDKDGKIAIDGFYDNIVDLTEDERAEIALVAEDEEALKTQLGIDSLWGEPGWTAREREWGRPTLDMNGIWGGFQGDGVKTVTPSEAHLKITCRLVPDQTPEGVIELIRQHVEKNRPPGSTVEVVQLPGSATPFSIDRNNPVHKAAEKVLTELFGNPPVITRAGGTIPATGIFQDELGIDTVNYA